MNPVMPLRTHLFWWLTFVFSLLWSFESFAVGPDMNGTYSLKRTGAASCGVPRYGVVFNNTNSSSDVSLGMFCYSTSNYCAAPGAKPPASSAEGLKVSDITWGAVSGTDANCTGNNWGIVQDASGGIWAVNFASQVVPTNDENSIMRCDDNDIFTYAGGCQSGPGGISTNLRLWMKPDTGVAGSAPITAWDSASGKTIGATINGSPTLVSDGMNFNPIMRFNGSSWLDTQSTLGVDGTNSFSIFAAYKAGATSVHSFLGANTGVDGGFCAGVNCDGLHYRVDGTGGYAGKQLLITDQNTGFIFQGTSTNLHDDTPRIVATTRNVAAFTFYQNGTVDGGTASGVSFRSASMNIGTVDGGNREFLNGDLAELIVFNSALLLTDVQKVNSYLAIKYGISLNVNYFNSAGTTLWNIAGSYSNDIAGIGRDDASTLNQPKSISNSTDALITIDGATLGTDLSYLIWGNDDAATLYTGTTAADKLHMARVWTVAETGTVGTVTVTSTDASAQYLLVGNNAADFSAATVYNLPASVDFSDGEFFTLAKDPALFPGHALDFDGTDDYVSASLVTTNTDNVTLEGWVYATAVSDAVLMYNGDASLNGYGLLLDGTSGKLMLLCGGVSTPLSDYVFPLNEWHHAALVREAGTWKLYVDGMARTLASSPVPIVPAPGATTLGASHTGGQPLQGRLDEVRIWSSARTQAQIKAYMNGPIPNPSGEANLVAYYPLDEGAAGGANPTAAATADRAGSNHGSLSGFALTGAASNWVKAEAHHSFQPGNGLDFDGGDDYVEVSYNASLNPAVITMEAWVKVTGGAGTNRTVVSNRSGVGFSGMTIYAADIDKWELWVGDTTWYVIEGSAVTLNQWTHLAGVFDGTNLSFYVNGVLFGSTPAGMTPNTTDILHIGRQVTGVVYGFLGKIDEVRIWNTARSAENIRAYMNRDIPDPATETNLVAYYPFDYGEPSGTNTGMTEVLDASMNGNNGTLTNFALSGASSNYVDSTAYNIWSGTGGDSLWSNSANWTDTDAAGTHLVPTTTTNVYLGDVGNAPNESAAPSDIHHLVIDSTGFTDLNFNVTGNAFAVGTGHNAGNKPTKLNNGTQPHYVAGIFGKGLGHLDATQPMMLADDLNIQGSGAYFTRKFPATVDVNGYTFSYSGTNSELIRSGSGTGDFGDEFPAVGGPERLTVMGSGSVSLTGDRTIQLLIVNGANLILDTYHLTTNTSSRFSGQVVATSTGELRISDFTPGIKLFPIGDGTNYTPIQLDVLAGSGAYISARLTSAKHPSNDSTTDFINRYWSLSTDATNLNATATATYIDPTDIAGTEANFKGMFHNGAMWTYGGSDAAANTVSATLTGSGEVTAGEYTEPTPASISNNLQLWLDPATAIAAGSITQWNDRTGNAYHFVPRTANGGPDLINDPSDGTFNFNPYVDFTTAQDRSLTTAAVGLSDTDAMTMFAVMNKRANSQILFQAKDNLGTLTWLSMGAAQVRDEGLINYAASVSSNQAHLVGGRNVANDSTGDGLLDGLLTTPGSLFAAQTSSMANDTAIVGFHNSFGDYTGMMSELLIYKRALSDLEVQQVSTYLSLKYGITSGVDYVISDGTTTAWTLGGGYDNDIAGIGRDDDSASLDQRKSKSVNAGSIVTMEHAAAFAANQQFLIWGNDAASSDDIETTEVPPSSIINRRLAREWKVANIGSVGAVNLTMDVSGSTLTGAQAILLIDTDNDADFTTGTPTQILPDSYAAGIATFNNVSFADGNVFTLVTDACATDPIVTSTLGDGSAGTLRDAVTWACAGSTITFDAALANNTIDVSSGGSLLINKDMMIDGGTHKISISGGSTVRVFDVDYSAAITASQATFQALTIKDGLAGAGNAGGGIRFVGKAGTITSLRLMQCALTGNNGGDKGGAVYFINDNQGAMQIFNSTLVNNTALEAGAVSVESDTASAQALILNSTISGNTATTGDAGGFLSTTANHWIDNSILYGNSSAGAINSGKDCKAVGGGGGATSNYIIGDANGYPCATLGSDPLLGALQDNGGSVPTMALLPGSPAVDAGSNGICTNATQTNDLDARGLTRSVVGGAICDIGAYEKSTPAFDWTSPPPLQMIATTAFSYAVVVTDNESTDGAIPVLSATGMPTWMALDPVTGILSGTPTNADAGVVNVTLHLNASTEDVQQAFTLTVLPRVNIDFSLSKGSIWEYESLTGTVSRSNTTVGDLIVTLSSSNGAAASMPATVTILDGQASVDFSMSGNNNNVRDGSRSTTITATATGYFDGTATLSVSDEERLLDVTITGQGDVTGAGIHQTGNTVQLVATPTTGWIFSAWGGECSIQGSIFINADSSCTATFVESTTVPVVYPLTAVVIGQGSVTGGGDYPENTPVSLLATPEPGWQFAQWGGDCLIDGSVIMDAAKNCTATFTEIPPNTVTLTTAVVGQGNVNGAGNYASGTAVSLIATPAEGWALEAWSGDCSGTNTSLAFTLNAHQHCVATFIELPPNTFTLAATIKGQGQVQGAGIKTEDSTAMLNAIPDTHWRFAAWGGDCGPGVPLASVTADLSVFMNASKDCHVIFEPEKYSLSVQIQGFGRVDNNLFQYDFGSTAQLSAIKGEGWLFTGWTGDCSSDGEILIDGDKQCTAIFSEAPPIGTPNPIADLDPASFALLTPEQVSQVDPVTLSLLSREQVEQIAPEAFAALSASQLGNIPPHALVGMTAEQLQALPPVSLSNLNAASFESIDPDTLEVLSAQQLLRLNRQVMTQELSSQAASRWLVNINPDNITPDTAQHYLPTGWGIDLNTGRLSVPTGTKVTYRNRDVPTDLPSQVILPDDIPDLNTSFSLGGRVLESGKAVDGLKLSIDFMLDPNAEQPEDSLFRIDQNEFGILRLTSDTDPNFLMAFLPDPGNMIVVNQSMPVGVNLDPGGFFLIVTPSGEQFRVLPAPANPVQLAQSLGTDSQVQITEDGSVYLEFGTEDDTPARRRGRARQVSSFQAFVEPAPDAFICMAACGVIPPEQLAPEYIGIFPPPGCVCDPAFFPPAPGMHAPPFRRIDSRLPLDNSQKQRLVYPDGRSQLMNPAFTEPDEFRSIGLQFEGVDNLVRNSNGTFSALAAGRTYLVKPEYNLESFELPDDPNLSSEILVDDNAVLKYQTPFNLVDNPVRRRGRARQVLSFQPSIEFIPEEFCFFNEQGRVCDFGGQICIEGFPGEWQCRLPGQR